MLLLSLACVAEVTSFEGQVRVLDAGMSTLGAETTPAPLLAYSLLCPEYECAGACPKPPFDPMACFDVTYTNVSFAAVGCRLLTDRPFEITFTPRACDAQSAGVYDPVADHVAFDVASAGEVLSRPLDLETLYEKVLIPGAEGWPTDWHQRPGDAWQIVAGSPFRFYPELYRAVDGAVVGWNFAFAHANGQGGIDVDWDPLLVSLAVEADEGDVGEVRFGVGSDDWSMAEVVGVPADAPTKLEVVAGYVSDAVTKDVVPFGARAVLRDGDGDLVWGAPVTWSLDQGTLALGDPYLVVPGPDHVTILDACVPPSKNQGAHQAVLRATYGDLSDTVALSWTVSAAGSDLSWTPNPFCVEGTAPPDTTTPPDDPGTTPPPGTTTTPPPPTAADVPIDFVAGGGCGCAPGAPPPVALLGLLGVVATRRRATCGTRSEASARGDRGGSSCFRMVPVPSAAPRGPLRGGGAGCWWAG